MCIPSLAPDKSLCQLLEILSGLLSREDIVPPPRARTARDVLAGGRNARTEPACTDARIRAEIQWGKLDAALDLIELGTTRTTGFVDRRHGERVQPITLTDEQRDVARRIADASRSCGAGLRAYHQWRPGRGYGTVHRLVAQLRCKTRACGACQARLRQMASSRMAFDARMFLTLTVPAFIAGVEFAWSQFHAAVCELTAVIRREAKYRNREITGRRKCDRTRKRKRRSLARSRLQGADTLVYAWAKEPQKSGSPHVHMLLSFSYVDYSWIREVWSRIWCCYCPQIKGKKVTSINGACHYLTTYVAKQRTSLDVLAIVQRRRMWASTVPKKPIEAIPWIEDKGTSEGVCRHQVANRNTALARDGWRVESGADDRYASWKRLATMVCPLRRPVVGFKVPYTWGDRPFNYFDTFLNLPSVPVNSMFFEEWDEERRYGKNRANSERGS